MHPTHQYAQDVLAGNIISGELIVAACSRHITDLKREKKAAFPFYFDADAATLILDFCPILSHYKGEFSGQPFIPEPWQCFILGNIFGWKHKDSGLRRFRTAYIEVPRKNGKTFLASAIGLAGMLIDGEHGAEIYSAATKKDQAKLLWNDACQMVRKSPALSRRIRKYVTALTIAETSTKFEPLGADSKTLDGLNPHMVLADELHAWPTPDLWNVLAEAMGARTQPLMCAITTAGYDREGICFQWRTHCRNILSKEGYSDDTTFGYIATIDEDDDWEDETTWAKANPNLGVSKSLDWMRLECDRARHMPSALNSFLTKQLNVWTDSAQGWLDMRRWDACGEVEVPDSSLIGQECYAGLDLSSTSDISALVLAFPREDGLVAVRCFFFCPEDNARERAKRDRVPYVEWQRDGHMIATPGNIIDYAFIRAKLNALADEYDIREVAYDRWNSSQIVIELAEDGATMVPFGQGYASMNPAAKALERYVAGTKLAHGNHSVLSWMARNAVVRRDPAGNIKPDKEKAQDKIDGIVALCMALGRLELHDKPTGPSVYEERGIISL